MSKLIDLTGQKFGRLTVIERAEKPCHVHDAAAYWKCRCDCGKEKIVSGKNLMYGKSLSCGCLSKEVARKLHLKHKAHNTSLYNRWTNMKHRCLNPNNTSYKYYGGRGITVCEEWRNDFQAFYDYVSKLPHFGEKGYSLDRINNDGNYEPGNVRWATAKEQANNRRPRRK